MQSDDVYDALPPLAGRTILDLGCGDGRQAAELAARGARVIGIDLDEGRLRDAAARAIPKAEFRNADLRALDDVDLEADGIFSRFAVAYFPDLAPLLAAWRRLLKPGGWMALIEIDDLFGHEPLSARAKALFDAYAADALAAGRYDFRMGRKLRDHLERAGFAAEKSFAVDDREFSFDGPAEPDVVASWRARFERMTLLRPFFGAEYEAVRDELLSCLARPEHRSTAKVICCVARLLRSDAAPPSPSPTARASAH